MPKREKSLVELENVELCRLLHGMVDDLVETRKKVADFEEHWKAVLKPYRTRLADANESMPLDGQKQTLGGRKNAVLRDLLTALLLNVQYIDAELMRAVGVGQRGLLDHPLASRTRR